MVYQAKQDKWVNMCAVVGMIVMYLQGYIIVNFVDLVERAIGGIKSFAETWVGMALRCRCLAPRA